MADLNDPIARAVDESQYVKPDGTVDPKAEAQEREAVRKLQKEYKQAREFDKDRRSRFALDRRYAAGTADVTWAVDTNLIGSYIDILVSFLYARDPDVSARKSPQVDNRGTKQQDDFAKTLELVVSRLWKDAKLKKRIRKQVRSALSCGPGWIKVNLICEGADIPQMQTELEDQRRILQNLEGAKEELNDNPPTDDGEIQAQTEQLQELANAATNKIEATIKKFLAVDFCRAETVQVSIDVEDITDYLDANWVGNHIYIKKDEATTKFPRLTDSDVASATVYHQRGKVDLQPITDKVALADGLGGIKAEDAEQYTSGGGNSGSDGQENGPEFVRVIEVWDKYTNHIKTLVEGIQRWAKEPYEPNYPSSRFYPYFLLTFFDVDGERYPQSLSHRLHKLQDEYARARSNWRVTRERAIPGVIFDASNIEQEDIRKIQNATHQEYTGIKPVDSSKPLSNNFAPKPTAGVDGRLFDTGPIVADMEKISGVQEALQASAASAKTATEAQIQQTGFASRTTADRDNLEDMLTELAQYTAECALTGMDNNDAMRIAGTAAFWPQGMDINDIMTMVEISIDAGTTGKPKDPTDRQAWGVILPALKEAIMEMHTAIAGGNLEMAKTISNLISHTMQIFDDQIDPEDFLPQIPDAPPPMPPPMPPPPKVSITLKGDLPPAAIPGLVAPAEPPPPAPPVGLPAPGGLPLPGPGGAGPPGPHGGLPLADASGSAAPVLPPSLNS